jgi:hypothetical protein
MNPELQNEMSTLIMSVKWLVHVAKDLLDKGEQEAMLDYTNRVELLLDHVSKGIPLWSDVPDEYEWIAMDSGNDWFGHKSEPEICDDEDWLQPNADWTGVHPYCPLGHKESAINWRESLERRPSGAKYIKR